MREIYFRSWDKIKSKYVPLISIDYASRTIVVGDLKSSLAERHRFKNLETDRFVLEHLTGLKDVNGKPIYEGDIVKSSYRYAQPKVSEVIIENGNTYISGEDVATGGDMLLCDFVDEIEVIGDIHQNKDLLEVWHE